MRALEIKEGTKTFQKVALTYGSAVKSIREWFNDKTITPENCVGFVRSCGTVTNERRLSASTYNVRVSALKLGVRSEMERYRAHNKMTDEVFRHFEKLEKTLQGFKLKKTSRAVDVTRIPTEGELKAFLRQCKDRRIKLIVEFLAHTGCRIDETLNILLTDIKPNHSHDKIRVLGKGNKERIIFVEKSLTKRIQEEFRGSTWLFEHSGRQYSRIATTDRIKHQCLKVLGHEYSAHAWRHYFVTQNIPRLGATKVSRYIGHSSVGLTLTMYDHSTMTPEDLIT